MAKEKAPIPCSCFEGGRTVVIHTIDGRYGYIRIPCPYCGKSLKKNYHITPPKDGLKLIMEERSFFPDDPEIY
jgi:hypothetical protein